MIRISAPYINDATFDTAFMAFCEIAYNKIKNIFESDEQ